MKIKWPFWPLDREKKSKGQNGPLIRKERRVKMSEERRNAMIANGDGIQFSHTLDEQIGGQLKAGFTLKALYEDRDGEGGNEIRKYYPQYVATLAVK